MASPKSSMPVSEGELKEGVRSWDKQQWKTWSLGAESPSEDGPSWENRLSLEAEVVVVGRAGAGAPCHGSGQVPSQELSL